MYVQLYEYALVKLYESRTSLHKLVQRSNGVVQEAARITVSDVFRRSDRQFLIPNYVRRSTVANRTVVSTAHSTVQYSIRYSTVQTV